MPDIPATPASALHDTLRNVLKASEAVKQGIATHAEKHAAMRHEQHAKLEADKKLTE